MTEPTHKPESPAETVARLEAIRAEDRTRPQNKALNRARAALLEIERADAMRERARKREEGLASLVAASEHKRTATVARARGGEYTPADRAKMGERVLAQLDAALDDLGNADPKDRASILSLAAKLSGLLAAERTEDVPFIFRGWTRAPMPVLPAGVVAPCPACGQALPTAPPEAPVAG